MKYDLLLKQLESFINQGDQLDVSYFGKWKETVIDELEGGYKTRFKNLEFYTSDPFSDDEIPF